MNYIEKALAMIAPSAFYEINPENVSILANAFKAAIEQHEATKQELSDFRQEVSDALWDYFHPYDRPLVFQRFIIPAPKPDPLVAAMKEVDICAYAGIKTEYADRLRTDLVDRFRAALDALGSEIREKNDG